MLPPEGQLDQHYNAVRLGAYEDLRPLIRSGIAVDEIYRFVAAKQLGENLSELRAAGGTTHCALMAQGGYAEPLSCVMVFP